MAQQESKQMIVGLDIGTSKVVAVVGEIDPDGGMEVVGIGSHPSRGMKKGCLLYTSPSPRDRTRSRMPSSA